MSDGVEQAIRLEILLLSTVGILDSEVSEEVSITLRFGGDSVPKNGDLRVAHRSLRHNL